MVARDKKGKIIPGWKDPRGAAAQNGFQQAEFVQYELSKDQQASCKAWEVSCEELFLVLERLLEAGYKITMRFDTRNNCPACWIIGPVGDHRNANMILPGRGSTGQKAFKQALFKHFQLFSEEWPTPMSKRDAEEIDD